MRHRIPACLAMALALPASPAPALEVAHGAGSVAWRQDFRSDDEDWINDLVPTRDGHVLAVGFLGRRDASPPSDWRALAAKLGVDGTLVASREYGAGGGIDAFWTAREQADGRWLFAGFTTRVGPDGINAYLLQAEPDFTVRRENGYGTPGYDRVTGLAATPDGFLAVGHAEGQDGRDVLYLGVDASGVERWRRVIADKGANGALYVEPAGDGNFIAVGGTSASGDADILVEKITPRGETLWRRTVGAPGTDDTNHGVVVLADGRLVVVGYSRSGSVGENDFLAALVEADGTVRSVQTHGGPGDDHVIGARTDASGRVWLVGWTKPADGDAEVMLARVDANGAFEDGVLLLGGTGEDHGTVVQPLAGGDLLVAGYGTDAFVLRLEAPRLAPRAGFEIRSLTP